jgi:triphosphatase
MGSAAALADVHRQERPVAEMPNEVELKLRIKAADIPRLKNHPAVQSALVGKPMTRKLTSIYYDTPALALLDADISLRVRRMSGGWFQAVKGAGHSLAGLHQRMEWEDIIARGEPDFSKITEPALTRIFDNGELRAALRPIFTTDVRRTEWQLAPAEGSQVEMALDIGNLIADQAREPISEVELELKAGEPARLFEFALALLESIPLWIENISKAQRGYAYYRPQPPQLRYAHKVTLWPAMTVEEACRTILWECIGHLQGNHDIVAQHGDAEGVHQMRVALRRMRSAMAIFAGCMSPADDLREELVWLATTLGEARDLDVFLTQTLPPMQQQLPHAGLEILHRNALKAHRAAYAEIRAALDSQRYQRLLLRLGAWLESGDHKKHEEPLAGFARDLLQKRHRKLRQLGKRWHGMNAEERHAARIAAKKLRYAAEFFSGLFAEEKSKRYLRRLSDLQSILGDLNDIAATDRLIAGLAGSRPRQESREAQWLFAGWNGSEAKRKMAKLVRRWDRFTQAGPFWN